MSQIVAVHAVEPRSRANGPGARFVIWFQGCSLGCPGCFNPGTHQPAAGLPSPPLSEPQTPSAQHSAAEHSAATQRATLTTPSAATSSLRHVDDLIADILAEGDAIEGITLSGGEPLEQPRAALAIAEAVRARSNLSILVFSGYSVDEIRAQPLGPAILTAIDVLIDGRYQAPQRLGQGLRGSHNQRIHLLSDRYRQSDVEATPEAEVRIDARGQIVLTGVDPLKLR
ncbi:MAG: 4Fe-4S cluster-binding domain-containing protein [Haliangiales bacterium]